MALMSPRLALLPFLVLCLALAACGGGTGPAATPSPSSPAASEPASPGEPALTPVPGGSEASAPPDPGGPSGAMTQTETDWGRIWDALPAGFPVLPGSIPTDPIDGPASGAFAVPAGPKEAADFMQAAAETEGYSTEALSGPFEDGSYVLDSLGESVDCRVQTRLTPLSGTTHMTVLFGAGCPFQ
jgi:hypothetical protein